MAEGTRMKTIEDSIKQLNQRFDLQSQQMELQSQRSEAQFNQIQQFMMEFGRQHEEQQRVNRRTEDKFEEFVEQMRDLRARIDALAPGSKNASSAPAANTELGGSASVAGILGAGSKDREIGGTHNNSVPRTGKTTEGSSSWNSEVQSNPNRFPKLEFSAFDGKRPRSWARKCEKYFAVFAIGEDQKVEIAAMYVTEKADVWLHGFLMQRPKATWQELVDAACRRFGEKQGIEIVEEFNKLSQGGDLEEYNERFEGLRACLLSENPSLPEAYFVSSYISGLKDEIKSLVKLGRPDCLATTFEQSRLHNNAVQAIVKLSKPPWRNNSFSPTPNHMTSMSLTGPRPLSKSLNTPS